MLQCYTSIKLQDVYWLKDACVQCRRAAFCHLEKPVAFKFFPGIIFGGDCQFGCNAVAACYCSSRVEQNLHITAHYSGQKFKFENECGFSKQTNLVVSSAPTGMVVHAPPTLL